MRDDNILKQAGREVKDTAETLDYVKMGMCLAVGNMLGIPLGHAVLGIIKAIFSPWTG